MIFLLSGCPGSGKTTTAFALMQRFVHGVRISVDDIREQVVSGLANPIPEWTGETTRQFTLARRCAGLMAREYSDAGFAVVVEDVGGPEELMIALEPLADRPILKVLIHPSAEICVERARTRTNKDFDPTRLCAAIPRIHGWIADNFAAADDWLKIDNADLSIDAVVDAILRATPRAS